jgi:hypothetical protein
MAATKRPPQPPERRHLSRGLEDRAEIPADADHNDRRGQHILHVLAQAGQKTAPGAERRTPEAVGSAGMRQGRRHLGQTEAEPEIHDDDDQRRDEQPAESARGQSEVPAEEVSGDHSADAERPQGPHPGIFSKTPLLEVSVIDRMVPDTVYALRL